MALVFLGCFWILESTGVIERNETVAIVGVVLFVVVAFPTAMLVGRASDRTLERER
ncbi:hypothetical protein GCM10009650_01140 [Nesterenkonia jeotgali]